MTNEKIKRLETELWGAADNLRANSKLIATEYKAPTTVTMPEGAM